MKRKKGFPEAKKIYRTDNYDQFSFLSFNRDVKRSNVEKLKRQSSEKFEMQNFPIIVDQDMKIKDGQHRFIACKEMDAPIYYVIDEERTGWRDVHRVNVAGLKHGVEDRVQMLLKTGDADVVAAEKIRLAYAPAGLRLSVVLRLLITLSKDVATTENIGRRKVELRYIDETIKVLKLVSRLDLRLPPGNLTSLIFAMCYVARNSPRGFWAFMERCEKHRHMITKKNTVSEYQTLFIYIHDYSVAEKNKFTRPPARGARPKRKGGRK